MGTRAHVGIVEHNKKIKFIYVGFDGHPSALGRILFNEYDTETQVRILLSMGDASHLDAKLDDCEFYTRDRGEDQMDTCAKEADNEEVFKYDSGAIDYSYLFKDDKWFVSHYGSDFKELTLELIDYLVDEEDFFS